MKNTKNLCILALFVAICAIIFACASTGKIVTYDSTATRIMEEHLPLP